METIGLVTKKDGNYIEVAVVREESCGSNCDACSARCAQTNTIRQRYFNSIDANVGDRILIEGKNSYFLKYMILVYGLPLLIFLISLLALSKIVSISGDKKDFIIFIISFVLMFMSYFIIKALDKKIIGSEDNNIILKRL